MSSGAILFLALLAGGTPATGTAIRLPPVEQCATVRGFNAFRRALRRAIRRHDSAALLALVSDDVTATFGQGGDGKQEFMETWGLSNPDPDEISPLWRALGEALKLGCARSGDALVAPSSVAQLDPMVDGFTALIAIRPGALMRAAPDNDAPVLAKLDWDLLTHRDADAVDGWMAVALSNGTQGFVRAEDVRSVLDYRAVFERRNGRWLMTAFVAGD